MKHIHTKQTASLIIALVVVLAGVVVIDLLTNQGGNTPVEFRKISFEEERFDPSGYINEVGGFFEDGELPQLQDASGEERDFFVEKALRHLKSRGHNPSYFRVRFPSRVGVEGLADGFYLFAGDKESVTISFVNVMEKNEACSVPMNLEGGLVGDIACGAYWAKL